MSNRHLSGRHILVVEDEMMILLLIEEILAETGASVAVAATVREALALIDAQVFDVATLDVNHNATTSYPVAGPVDIIRLTGSGHEDTIEKSGRAKLNLT
jgi:CheY-like chemotaxis protein